MATKGKKGKEKDKGEKKKNPQVVGDNEALQEIDKQFYEIQITDLNQKLARLRSRVFELEAENEESKKDLQKLDEDRADIIAYQKRTLLAKSAEVTELQERLKTLQQTREAEKNTFVEKIKAMEHDFKSMHEQLNAEIKLLHGKLNSLEEFRREREELMNKFLKQEQEMEEQEKRHQITLYEVERKFIVGKDELKKDMEQKLLQLSLDFQNTTDIRIATTTHRAIRENVALNNEMNLLLDSWNKLAEENRDLKLKAKELKIDAQMQREDNKILLKKNAAQNKIIEKITSMHKRMEDSFKEMSQVKKHEKALEVKLDLAESELKASQAECQKLRQVIEALRVEECGHEVELLALRQECSTLRSMVEDAVHNMPTTTEVRSDLELDGGSEKLIDQRDYLLSTLMGLFNRIGFVDTKPPGVKDSVETLYVSDIISDTYSTGDVGVITKQTDVVQQDKLQPSVSRNKGKM